MDLRRQTDVDRLRSAMRASRRKLKPFRTRHREAITEYVGVNYSDSAADKPSHLNLMEIAANVYERQLVARPPQILVFTKNDEVRPWGVQLESLMNSRLKEDEVHKYLRRSVKSALFSIGIAKVGLENVGRVEESGIEFEVTQPFVRNILMDDWVHDMSARDMDEVGYCGHRYRMSYEDAKKNTDFKKGLREKLRPIDIRGYNETGDPRINTLSEGHGGFDTDFEEKVELWEVWIPKLRKLVTFSDSLEGELPLRTVDWEGPDRHLGPFHLLWFNEVDGNSMPLAPAMLWVGLHDIVNGLYRKLERQAQRSKSIGLTRGMDTQDAEKIRQASDGEIVAVDNPEAVLERTFGGIDQRNFAFMLQSKNLWDWASGNISAMGGLGASSDTVGQDRMINASASQRVSGMQDQVMRFTQGILESYGYWLWKDPIQVYDVELSFPDLPPLMRKLTPEDRETHGFYEHNVEIEPYSMQYLSPGDRLSSINQIVTSVIMPALPLMQQQGMGIDMNALLEIYAKYANLPELRDIVIQEEVEGSEPAEPRQSPVTTRTNERVNRAGAPTRENQEQMMIQQMMAGDNNAT